MGTFLYFFAIFLFLLLCVLLCFIILMQESKSSGLGSSFGGDASESVFGTSTADVLKKITAWMAAIFLASCIILSMWTTAIGRNNVSRAPTPIEQIEQ
ncbi:preprotein translocase subunit SecG [Candidatus Rubidus massiliensis]|nr:MAG: preprotein translocase subunit SecG [Chlamydia sp. 32-24]CDZ80603.1 preprotein translocase subunit SecG [Candidatus Rubidus massiliensis]